MGKAKRNRIKRKALRERVNIPASSIPMEQEKVPNGYSCWICGYYWDHDMVIIEPFCAVKNFNQWIITNLNELDMDYYQAKKLLEGEGTMLIYYDRVAALDACEVLHNERLLLESFSGYMSAEDLIKYVEGKEGASYG